MPVPPRRRLAHDQAHGALLAASNDAQRQFLSDTLSIELDLGILRSAGVPATDGYEQIAHQQPCLGPRPIRFHADDEEAVVLGKAVPAGNRFAQIDSLKPKPEIASLDPTRGHELIDDSIHGRAGNGQRQAVSKSGRIHADQGPFGGEEWPSRKPG